MKDLIKEYNIKKDKIKERLKEFDDFLKNAEDEDVFSELCFCILTPQSKAIYCDRAVKNLKNSKILLEGCCRAIKTKLTGVRFPNNKSKYIALARKFFKNGSCIDIISKLNKNNPFETREWLVKNIKGIGFKEASHFLRNIGLGKDMAILDRHILKNLKRYKIINKIPVFLSKKAYLEIEKKLKEFSKKIKIPLDELDLLFWSNKTGFIFK